MLSVTSPDVVTEASYGFQVNIPDNTEPLHTANAAASYMVEASCNPATPSASVTPASQSAAAGSPLDYTVSLTNMDSSNCDSSKFSISALVPDGWTGTVTPDTLTLSPGQSGDANLSISSPVEAAEDSYGVTVSVSDANEPSHTTSGNAGYLVEGIDEADIEAPTAPGGLSAGLKGKNIKLTWNATTDNVGVNGYAVWRDDARIGNTTDTVYVDSSVPSGRTCIYRVSAYDAAGNTSLSSNAVTVTARGGSKGGGKERRNNI